MSKTPALEVTDLCVRGPENRDVLSDVSLELHSGGVTAIVGETGSGKTTLVNSILGLLPMGLRLARGKVIINDGKAVELSSLLDWERRQYLGLRVGYVPQDVRSGLNPLMTARATVLEAARRMQGTPMPRVADAFRRAGLDDGFIRHDADRRPGKLSGGQCQRVLIAQAIVNHPRVLLMDEPTASLDSLAKLAVLETIHHLTDDGCAVCLVTHDIAAVAGIADHVSVMYLGRVVESGPAKDVFSDSRHPYSQALIGCVPRLDHNKPIVPIQGVSAANADDVSGCKFHPRCPYVEGKCLSEDPPLLGMDFGRKVACHVLEI